MKRITSIILSQALLLCSLSPVIARAEMFGDINGDGSVNATDASYILQYSAYVGAGGELSLYAYMEYDKKGETPPVKLSSFADSADSKEYVSRMAEIIDIESDTFLIGIEDYGALDGRYFKHNGQVFNLIHLKSDDERLEIAKTGEIEFKDLYDGSSDGIKTLSSCNGDYILLYRKIDEEVIKVFMQ